MAGLPDRGIRGSLEDAQDGPRTCRSTQGAGGGADAAGGRPRAGIGASYGPKVRGSGGPSAEIGGRASAPAGLGRSPGACRRCWPNRCAGHGCCDREPPLATEPHDVSPTGEGWESWRQNAPAARTELRKVAHSTPRLARRQNNCIVRTSAARWRLVPLTPIWRSMVAARTRQMAICQE